MLNIKKNINLFRVYIFAFLFAFHVAIPTFINSSFLNTFISERILSLVYAAASVLTIILFFLMPYVLRQFGNYKTTIFMVFFEMAALACLAFSENLILVISSFIISLIVIAALYFSLDIFLEGLSTDEGTGKIRGIYLTLMNLSWVIAPVLNGFILQNDGYWKIYLFALLLLVPALLVLVFGMRNFEDSAYQAVSVFQTISGVWKNKNIRNIFGATFLLNFFYSWMTIYTPIYLNKYIGFSWEQIGFIFGIMLLPFVFLQFPLGRLADEKLGEKEILSSGFMIIAISTVALFFIPNNSGIWVWAALLFITRIGACAVEVMTDTYFFKSVNNLNANMIGFYRMARPLAYMLGSVAVTFALTLVRLGGGKIFLILGIITSLGLIFSLKIEDTK